MISIIFSLLISMSHADTVKVAIIDTGFDASSTWPNAKAQGLVVPKVCKDGYITYDGAKMRDPHGHGTHIAGLVAKYADDSDYCLMIYKYYDSPGSTKNLTNSNRAFRAAIKAKVDIINFSAGGPSMNLEECVLVSEALDKGIKVVAAAGNFGVNIDRFPYYPASCDDRVTVVVNMETPTKRADSSNYSNRRADRTVKEHGVNILSLLPYNQTGVMTGTSQATAITTGKLVKKMYLDRRDNEKLLKKTTKRKN